MSMKNSSDTIENRTRDLPTCSAVLQPTAPPRAPTIDHVSSWMGGMCLLWYATISKLMLSNYNGVGRHNATGKQNVCLTGELSQNLLSPTHNRYFLLTHILQRHMWIPSLPEHELGSPLWTLQHTDPCRSEGLQYSICQNTSCRSINWPSAALTTKQ